MPRDGSVLSYLYLFRAFGSGTVISLRVNVPVLTTKVSRVWTSFVLFSNCVSGSSYNKYVLRYMF